MGCFQVTVSSGAGDVSSKRKHHTVVGTLVYADLFGPYTFPSFGKARYFVVFLDDASGHVATFFLKTQKGAEITSALNEYITLMGKGCMY